MSFSINPKHVKKYKELARFLIKYGRLDILAHAGLEKGIADEVHPHDVKAVSRADELPRDLERLGPTYVKLGQFLSTRSDLLTDEYIEALARLQDRAELLPYETIEEIIKAELGLPIPMLFSFFNKVPLAAASLAQVHHATLLDGRAVAVKVQRPGIRNRIVIDLEVLSEVAGFLDRHTAIARKYMLEKTIAEFRKAILRELDFRQEGQNLKTLAEDLKDYKLIVVPMPVESHTTSKVLTMDYIRGQKITTIVPLRRPEINGSELAEELFRAYLKQILVDGFYHADPHPGNVFLTDDNRIALLDLGMVARMSEAMQKKLFRLTLAISEGKGDEAVQYAVEIGEKTPAFDDYNFAHHVQRLVVDYQQAKIGQIEVGKVILEVLKAAGDSGFRLPSELALLGKCLLNLDNIGRTLDPDFDPSGAIRRYSGKLLRERLMKSISTANLYELAIDSKDLVEQLPRRLNKIAEILANNEFKLNVDAFDERYLMMGIQKIANRLALGMILAATIVGAAIIMEVPTPHFTLFGYPGLAIIFFLIAAVGGLFLATAILISDERTRKKSKDRL